MWKYKGQVDSDEPGAHRLRDHLPDIPARDIDDAEAKENGWEATLASSPIYERIKEGPKGGDAG